MDIVKLITEKTVEISKNGKLDEIIEKNVLKCVENIVSDSFSWNGEAKKSIEEALKGKLAIPVDGIDVQRYTKIISSVVEEELNNTVLESAKEGIKESVQKIAGTLDFKEISLSKVIEKYIYSLDDSYDGEMENQYGELTLIVNDDRDDWIVIYFDKESDKNNYECKNKLFLSKNKIASLTIDEELLHPFHVGNMSSFESFMFSLYTNQVKIIVDEENCELEYSREDAH